MAEHDLLARYISRIRKEEGEGKREGKDVRETLEKRKELPSE